MPTGSCLCGGIKVSFTGEPAFKALCHCLDDRKLSNTAVWQVPKEGFSVTQGTPKLYTKKSDAGRDIHTHFCGECGTALFRTGGDPRMDTFIGLRAGVLDNPELLDEAPKVEVYVERRPKWMSKIENATQLNEKYEIVGHGAAK